MIVTVNDDTILGSEIFDETLACLLGGVSNQAGFIVRRYAHDQVSGLNTMRILFNRHHFLPLNIGGI